MKRASAALATKSFVTLGTGEMLSRLLGFGATIWIARQLGVDAYGIVGFAFAATLYLAVLADAGMEQLGPREVATADGSRSDLISSVLTARLLFSIVLAGLLALLSPLLLDGADAAVLAAYGTTLIATGANARWALLGLDRAGGVSVARIVAEALRAGIVLFGVRGPEDLMLVPLAQLAGDGAGAALIAGLLRREGIDVRPAFDRRILRAVYVSARPLLLTNILALVIYNSDVLLLRGLRGTAETGLYLAAYTLINFLGVLGNTATVSLIPSLSRLQGDAVAATPLLRTAVARVVAVGLPLAAGGTLLAHRLIPVVFGEEYAMAGPLLAILIWSIPLLLIRSVFLAGLIATGHQQRVLHATAYSATVSVGLNLLLIPFIGPVGAAISTVLAEGVRMVAAAFFLRDAGLRAPGLHAFWRTVAATVVMSAIVYALRGTPLPLAIAAGGVTYLLVVLIAGGPEGRVRPAL